jgi:ribosome maturation factor RimP
MMSSTNTVFEPSSRLADEPEAAEANPPAEATVLKAGAPGPISPRLVELAEEICAREGCWLYDLELLGGAQSKIVRVTVDRDDRPVGVDDCANVSHGLSLLLDVEDLVQGHYNLEVSSPGLERSLKVRRHFEKAAGQTVQIKTKEPIDIWVPDRSDLRGQKSVRGVLVSVESDSLSVDNGKGPFKLPMSGVAKAHVVFESGPAPKPGHKPGQKLGQKPGGKQAGQRK